MTDVRRWLESLGLGRYADSFEAGDIDGDLLPELDHDVLKELGVESPGHRLKILRAARASSRPAGEVRPAAAGRAEVPSAADAERRHLTVMFVDLVGSTALAETLDPEDNRELLAAYQSAATSAIESYEGYVARYMGDGLLAYFGYPQAHEDDPERAVRAALDTADGVARLALPGGFEARLRIGIATGHVVAGDIVGEGASEERAVLGETPNLASRLQGAAEAGTIVVASATRRLLGDLFELEDLGMLELRGVSAPVRAWRVRRSRTAANRFEAVRGQAMTPLIGREHEMALLGDRWGMAAEGEGQVVLLSGEAGVGKSRIVAALREMLDGQPHTSIRYQCSPHHTNSALFPIVDQLMAAVDVNAQDAADAKLDRLEGLLAEGGTVEPEVLGLFVDLLLLPGGDRYPRLDLTPNARKDRTLGALVDLLAGLADRQPTLVIFEDAHWMDPTTRELIDLVLGSAEGLHVLLLITCRPEFESSWGSHPSVTTLSLGRLGRRERLAMVERLTAGTRLPETVREEIVAKTDGIPLFIEELVRTVLDSPDLAAGGDRPARAEALPLAIPTTLQDSLMARLDRLGPAKEVAQIGAALGREFTHELVSAVAGLASPALDEALDRIVTSGLVFRRGVPPRVTYVFKHALVQDVAYESLLRRRRRELHESIAVVMRERFAAWAERSPEMLAHHFTEAGRAEEAVEYWLEAGRQAILRSAGVEASGHLRRGLEVLVELPATPARDSLELALLVALGPVMRATRGYADEDLVRTYTRARELCLATGETSQLPPILMGLSFCRLTDGDYRAAREYGEQCLSLAQGNADHDGIVGAHRAIGSAAYWLGGFPTAREHLERALAMYDPVRHESLTARFGDDPQVTCLGYLASTVWSLGLPDRARAHAAEGLRLARQRAHPYSVAMALVWAAWVGVHVRDPTRVLRCARELRALASERGYPHWVAFAEVKEGWAAAHGSSSDPELVRLMRRRRRDWLSVQGRLAYTWLLTTTADACLEAGAIGAGLEAVDEALDLVRESGGESAEAEIYRLRGELELHDRAGAERAEASFRSAIDCARRQQARSWELRAVTSLARLWHGRGEAAPALELLRPCLESFAEGFETPDVVDATRLVRALEARGRVGEGG